jgi:IS5 family transposase
MERKSEQPTFLDAAALELGGPRTMAFLDKCERLIPWEKLAGSVADVFSRPAKSDPDKSKPAESKPAKGEPARGEVRRGGRPHWPVKLYVKCLMLQKWFNLSDPQLEEQLRDRISFRRFVGLGLTEPTPDETSLVVFRRRLREAGHERTLFEAVHRHLQKLGLILNTGTLVDATIVEAPRGRRKDDGTSTRDADASFTKKNGRTYHGYKGHIATDRRGIVKDFRFDTARVHDSRHIDALIRREKQLVVADSAYMDQAREQRLRKRGVCYAVVKRRVRGQAELPVLQKLLNQVWSSIRAVVEHPLAWIRNMGYRKVRYRGLARNALDFGLLAAAYNLKRSFSLRGV